MAFSRQILPEPLRSIDSATFTGSYQNLGTPLANEALLVKFVNNSTVVATVSWFGGLDHDVYPGGSYTIYDITSNAPQVGGLYIAKGTQFQVKGSAGTGSVYLVVLYGRGG